MIARAFSLTTALLAWARGRRAHLPWRGETDPYRIWVSEIMLQQTRTETAGPYYLRFLQAFPTVQALARAPLDEVLRLWEGLGYYGRARSLHAAALVVVGEHAGALPRTAAGLRALPGIGEYTAGAIASLAFGEPEPALDGNGRRVLARLLAEERDPSSPAAGRRLRDVAAALLPPGEPGAFNAGLMDLGATVCTPRRPCCPECPWQEFCLARAQGRQEDLPVAPPRHPLPHYDMAAGLIWHEGRLLVARRPAKGLLGGLWALPGGRCDEGEAPADAVVRCARQGLGVEVAVEAAAGVVEHAYTHFRITLYGFVCRYVGGEPRAVGYAEWRWVTAEQAAGRGFPVTDRRLLRAAGPGART